MGPRTPRSWLLVVAAFSAASCGKMGPPPLTEARVIEDLGEDRMRFVFHTLRADCVDAGAELCRRDKRSFHDDELAAATAAGWVESTCENDAALVRLTDAGKVVAARARTSSDLRGECNSLQPFELEVARYDRTGPPRIEPGETPNEKMVTIPGRWIPNDDGHTLVKAGYPPIVVVDRKEKFTFWKGRWARHHVGD